MRLQDALPFSSSSQDEGWWRGSGGAIFGAGWGKVVEV